ncbi:MAG: PilZ domain-containing protein [Terriglobales bacterium]
MANTLLERIWFTCRHQFSWPRRADDGDYYQVCLECGVKYQYDWHAMRRTTRIEQTVEDPEATGRKPVRKCSGKNGWHPRDRRLKVESPVQFREKGAVGGWCEGRSENISRSGLLFTVGDNPLPIGTEIELIFHMPAEICGDSAADVLCQARVVRVLEATKTHPARVAAAIADYTYLPKSMVG